MHARPGEMSIVGSDGMGGPSAVATPTPHAPPPTPPQKQPHTSTPPVTPAPAATTSSASAVPLSQTITTQPAQTVGVHLSRTDAIDHAQGDYGSGPSGNNCDQSCTDKLRNEGITHVLLGIGVLAVALGLVLSTCAATDGALCEPAMKAAQTGFLQGSHWVLDGLDDLR